MAAPAIGLTTGGPGEPARQSAGPGPQPGAPGPGAPEAPAAHASRRACDPDRRLTALRGGLERLGEGYAVAGGEVDFDPWHLAATAAGRDSDGDRAPLAAELAGLAGARVEVGVDAAGRRARDVDVLNCRRWRALDGFPPP